MVIFKFSLGQLRPMVEEIVGSMHIYFMDL